MHDIHAIAMDVLQSNRVTVEPYVRNMALQELRLLCRFDEAFRKNAFEGRSSSDSLWNTLVSRFTELVDDVCRLWHIDSSAATSKGAPLLAHLHPELNKKLIWLIDIDRDACGRDDAA